MLAPLPRQPLPFREAPGVLSLEGPGPLRPSCAYGERSVTGSWAANSPDLVRSSASAGPCLPRPFTSPGGTSHPPAGPTLLLPSAQRPLSNGELKPESCLPGLAQEGQSASLSQLYSP